jgi:hypothetical protein
MTGFTKADRYSIQQAAPNYLAKPGERKRKAGPRVKDWRFYGRKLTKVFNRWIRYRDTTPAGGDRMGLCITCRKPKLFDALEACHFESSQFLGTKWDEQNVHAGCAYCNKWLEGNKVEYAKALIAKYGPGILDQIAVQKKLNAGHPDILTLQAKIADYTERLKAFE